MADTTDIEKKSLEAHVELCAERYRSLDERLDNMTDKISKVEVVTNDIKSAVSKMAEKSNDRLINWGIGIIVFLLGALGWMTSHFIIK